MDTHQKWMQKVLELAEKGRGYTSPNPVVGAIILRDSKVIGQGYHSRFGAAHAEIEAIKDAGEDLTGTTLYVNLEPCCYHGKTPPCVEAIIQAGISKVVVGMIDPNPRVNGKGIGRLRAAGVEVELGILEEQCREANRGFMRLIESQRPWVTLKLATTCDGFIADVSGKSKWISSPDERGYVKQLRAQYDAIMVGIGTVMKDDPALLPSDRSGFIPYRVVLDGSLNIPFRMQLVSDEYRKRTVIVTIQKGKQTKIAELRKAGLTVLQVDGDDLGWIQLEKALAALAEFGVSTVYCEGGGMVAGSLITQRLVDELHQIISPKIIGEGIFAFGGFMRTLNEAIELRWQDPIQLGPDILLKGKLI